MSDSKRGFFSLSSVLIFTLVVLVVIVSILLVIYFSKGRQKASIPLGPGGLPKKVEAALPLNFSKQFKFYENSYPSFTQEGIRTIEADLENLSPNQVEVVGEIKSKPFIDLDNKTKLSMSFPSKTNNITANVVFGPQSNEIIVLFAKGGVVDSVQNWQGMKVSELTSFLKAGDPILVRIYLTVSGEIENDPRCDSACKELNVETSRLSANNLDLIKAIKEETINIKDNLEVGPVSAVIVYAER